MGMDSKTIIFHLEKGIATITFNRPQVLNALNRELLTEFMAAVQQIAADEEVKVLVLTGAGDRAFIAGADIKQLSGLNGLQGREFARFGQAAINSLQDLSIPVIAAVNGFALGGGCEMALGCDFIYASEKAQFGLPEITLGIIPGFGGTQRLARLVGRNIAKEMIFTGKMISASEAKSIGLVNKVVSPELLMEEALATAADIASKGKVAIRAAKQAINSGMDVDLATGNLMEADGFALCLTSEDALEGTSAFLEKRKPVFKGPRNG